MRKPIYSKENPFLKKTEKKEFEQNTGQREELKRRMLILLHKKETLEKELKSIKKTLVELDNQIKRSSPLKKRSK